MTDIVERLRNEEQWNVEQPLKKLKLFSEAADEIERLRKAMEIVADALYDKGDYECWAALRNTLWQDKI